MPKLIYLLRNTVNGKCYVGQTGTSLNKRLSAHRSDARRGRSYPICRAIAKHGWAAFEVEVLEVADDAAADQAEQAWISKIGSLKPAGYNAETGGVRGNRQVSGAVSRRGLDKIGVPRPPEVRALISEALTGRRASDETRAKMSAAHKGAQRRKGQKQGQAERDKRSASLRAYHQRRREAACLA